MRKDYAAFTAAYAGLALASTRAAGQVDRRDLPVLAAATFAIGKLVAKERVGEWLREALPPESAPGELVRCSRCVGVWASLALVTAARARPDTVRPLATALALSAANDYAQAAFTGLCGWSNMQAYHDRSTPSTR